MAIDPFFPSFGNNGIDVQHYDLQIAIGDDPNVLTGRAEAIRDPTLPANPTAMLGWMTFADTAYVASEPIGASTFFPANDEPDDRATFDITVTVDDPNVNFALACQSISMFPTGWAGLENVVAHELAHQWF